MIKVAVVDLDGTIYKGNKLEPGVSAALSSLLNNDIKIYFCTNNSSNSPYTIINKLEKMGIECDEDHLITSGTMAARYCKKHKLEKIYLYGTDELRSYYIKCGLNISDDTYNENLIIGMDSETDYMKLTKAIRVACNARNIIICNKDKTFPKEDGIYPGCGCAVAAILYCANVEKSILIGKPSTLMLEYIRDIVNCKKEEIVVIGDGIESDMEMAKQFGCKSILVGIKRINGLSVESLTELAYYDWTLV